MIVANPNRIDGNSVGRTKSQQWWIVEDALRNRQGHWFAYLDGFLSGLAECGVQARFFCDATADHETVDHFEADPILPQSIWHRMSSNASLFERVSRIPLHGRATYKALQRALTTEVAPDWIFVPTVLVHHLTGYWQLLSGPLHRTKTRLLLFFPNTPIRYDRGTGGPVLEGGMQSKLFRLLIKRLAKYVAAGKAVLGVETEAMQRALTNITGVPFQYLPHPVAAPELHAHPSGRGRPLVFGAYGAARFEKGSDILQAAIERHFTDFPQSDSQFRLQWIDDFRDEQGILIGRSKRLQADPRVEYITHYFAACGTGGTLTGTARFLKRKKPGIQIIGVDAYGSVLKKYHETGEFDENEIYPYKLEAVGKNIIPANVDFDLVDEFVKVRDGDAAFRARELATTEGILAGYSSGAALQGVFEYADRLRPEDVVVVLFSDHGSKYFQKIFNDDWMREQGFME